MFCIFIFSACQTFIILQYLFLLHDAFIRTDRGVIVLMFVHLSFCLGRACIVIIQCT